MTGAMAGMPPTGYGPDRPLPGGRAGRRDGERDARRIAAKLAAAQRRLGQGTDQVQPTASSPTVGVIVDLPVTVTPGGGSRMRGALRRMANLRYPRRRA
jgi:hypothetical protein